MEHSLLIPRDMDEDGRSPSARSLAHKTRACGHCARLKMKCQWPGSGSGRPENTCTRCARMKLACHVPEPVQRKKRGKSTRVSQLEEKIEGLVSFLSASQHLQGKGLSPLTPESQDNAHPKQHTPQDSPVCTEPEHQELAADLSSFELFPGFCITDAQANAYLSTYRSYYMPKYPFVIIPAGLDAYDLWRGSRILFWAVMGAVAPQSVAVQNGVKDWFRKHIAEHIIVRRERRLDLLQAILVHLGWGDFHFYMDTPATGLLQIATTLILDLKLDKETSANILLPSSLLGDAWQKVNRGLTKAKTPHTLDDKRALLGFYHVSNLIASMFRTVVPLPWSMYIERCCDSLVEAAEYETDPYIAALVRMQRIANRAYQLMADVDVLGPSEVALGPPLDMALNSAQTEIQTFADSQSESIKQNKLFWLFHNVLILRLYEPVMSMRAVPDSKLLSEPIQRSEKLWRLLQACSEYFDAQLMIPFEDIPTLPFTCSITLSIAIITTSRLVLLEPSADWDPATARTRFDFPDAAWRLGEQYEKADQWAASTKTRRRLVGDGESLFHKYNVKLRWVRQWFLSKFPPEQPQLSGLQSQDIQVSTEDLMQFADSSMVDFSWEDLFTDPTLLVHQTPNAE